MPSTDDWPRGRDTRRQCRDCRALRWSAQLHQPWQRVLFTAGTSHSLPQDDSSITDASPLYQTDRAGLQHRIDDDGARGRVPTLVVVIPGSRAIGLVHPMQGHQDLCKWQET
ncbi:hypothetical protein HPB50_023795 [Hyalomma asiaticum]|uniref:Uncharacterized protein n=1 Tax=Hyalomma asiaticum TaxID=266040 RepID=A0ACB7TBZ7_HYAAI|nr:hypothetical protein HPB50_023795 [Hyalomma asiaticum]